VNGRSVEQVFAKNESLLKTLQSYIQETKQAKTTLIIKNGQFDNVEYEFIGRRKEGKNKIEVFSIILKEGKGYNTFFR